MIVKPCPPECKFDWEKFHKQLDWAMAHMIEEKVNMLPSKTSLIEFAEYSNAKQLAQKGGDDAKQ